MNDTDPSALKGKKVYIVPGIEYTNDRLRGTLDALDIKITGSLKRADAVVVGKTLEVLQIDGHHSLIEIL